MFETVCAEVAQFKRCRMLYNNNFDSQISAFSNKGCTNFSYNSHYDKEKISLVYFHCM